MDAGAVFDKVNGEGDSSFLIACSGGHSGVTRLLMGAGADIHRTGADGWSALHNACAQGTRMLTLFYYWFNLV